MKFIFLQLWAERYFRNIFPEGRILFQYNFLLAQIYFLTNDNRELRYEAGYFDDATDLSQLMPVYTYNQHFPVWLQCTHVGSALTCWLQRCGAVKLYVDTDFFVFTMSSSFFIKSKQNPKFAKKGKNATALKRKVSYSVASKHLRLKHNAVGLLVYLPNIFWTEDYDIFNRRIVLQGEGDATGRGKVLGKKAGSKYNEEISSDSETEGLVSDIALTLKCCTSNSFTFWKWTTELKLHNDCNCVLFAQSWSLPEKTVPRGPWLWRDAAREEASIGQTLPGPAQGRRQALCHTLGHLLLLKCQNMSVCLLLHVFITEENKAEDDSFEADLIAGRLQEEVVRLERFLKVTLVFEESSSGVTSNFVFLISSLNKKENCRDLLPKT